jgi:hypothetical protein
VQQLQQLADTLLSWGTGPQSVPLAAAQLAQQMGQQASLLACLDYFGAIAVIGMAGAIVMLVQRRMN